MLVFNSSLQNVAIASVQSGATIASTTEVIIDPRQLHIAAFYVDYPKSPELLVLHTSDIREFTPVRIIIDHDEQLMETNGLVRLQDIIDINFSLVQKPVKTEDGTKIGKVISYVVDTESWYVMRIHVSQPLRSVTGPAEKIISRQQIVKVTDDEVIVKSTAAPLKSTGSTLKRLLFGSPRPSFHADSSSESN